MQQTSSLHHHHHQCRRIEDQWISDDFHHHVVDKLTMRNFHESAIKKEKQEDFSDIFSQQSNHPGIIANDYYSIEQDHDRRWSTMSRYHDELNRYQQQYSTTMNSVDNGEFRKLLPPVADQNINGGKFLLEEREKDNLYLYFL